MPYKNKNDEKEYRKKRWQIHNKEQKEYNKRYYLSNKPEIQIYKKNYTLNNKEKLSEYHKEYYLNNKDKKKIYKMLLYKKNKDKIKQYGLEHREKIMIRSYNRNDKKKDLICDLTESWLKENITSKPCVYCGETEKIGCDRINNSQGHTKINVIPCCSICNFVRNKFFSVEEMHKIGFVINQIKKDRKINTTYHLLREVA